jgi:uncharacterized protein (TIGR02246 family)
MLGRSALPTLALVLFACQPVARPLSDADVAAVRATADGWEERARAGDWAAVAALYAEDARLMPPNAEAVQGRAAIQAFWEAFPLTTDIDITSEEVDGRGDLAFDRGSYSVGIMPEGTSEPITDRGKYVVVARRQADGSWLMAIDIFNSNLPLPE